MSVVGARILPKAETKKENDVFRVISDLFRDVRQILNGGIKFSDNFDAKLVEFTSHATADTEKVCAHTLGKIPSGYIVYSQDKAGSLYTGVSDWTASNIYLKCSVASVTFKLIIF